MSSNHMSRGLKQTSVFATSLAALALLLADASGQVPGNRNGIRLYNLPETSFLHSFPNFFTSGNAAGDSLWQITSSDVLRHPSGGMELTAIVMPIYVQNFRAATPVELPDFEIRQTMAVPSANPGCLQPDFGTAPIATVSLGAISLPAAGAYRVEIGVLSGAGQTGITIPNGDIALNILATPNENSTTTNAVRFLVSLEGSAADRRACGFGSLGTRNSVSTETIPRPSNFELQTELAFREPVMFAVRDDPFGGIDEGRGAMDFLITRDARIGWRAEALQGIDSVLVPYFSFTGASTLLPLYGQFLLLDPTFLLDMLIVFQQAGPITSNGAVPPATDGVWSSDLFSVPRLPELQSVSFNVASLIFNASGVAIDSTNTVTTRLKL